MSAREQLAAWRRSLATRQAYHRVFGTPEGALVLRDILKKAGVLETGHVAGDAASTSWNDGRRSLGLEIIHALRWTEGELVALAVERTSETLDRTED